MLDISTTWKKFRKLSKRRKRLQKLLIGPAEGWDGWVMLFTLRDKKYRHSHEWPHINYVISGRGSLYLKGKDYPLRRAQLYSFPGAEHQFSTLGNEDFIFI